MTPPKTTWCECAGPGDCPRHQLQKTPAEFQLCQSNPAYCRMWDQRAGVVSPPQPVPHHVQTAARRRGRQRSLVGQITGSLSKAIDLVVGPVAACCGNARPAMPPLHLRAVEAAKAMTRIITHGLEIVPPRRVEERLVVCQACPMQDAGWCTECGCFLNAKARLGTEHCPRHFWPEDPARPSLLIQFPSGLGDMVCHTSAALYCRQRWPQIDVWVECDADHQAWIETFGFKTLCRGHAPKSPYTLVHSSGYQRPHECYADRPSTTDQAYLRNFLDGPASPALYNYQPVAIPQSILDRAFAIYAEMGVPREPGGKFNAVVTHCTGKAMRGMKDVPLATFGPALEWAKQSGYRVFLLDHEHRQGKLHGYDVVPVETKGQPLLLAAMIQLGSLFVGIDSGPSHMACAVPSTPAIVCWTKHHPVHCMNVAPHVTHLVPSHHADLLPGEGRSEALVFHKQHYDSRVYFDLPRSLRMVVQEKLYRTTPAVDHDFWVDRGELRQCDLNVVGEHYPPTNDSYHLAELPLIQAPQTILDVGTHIGVFSRVAADRWPGAAICGVEPIERNARLARKNCPGAMVQDGVVWYGSSIVTVASCIHPGTSATGGSYVDANRHESLADTVKARCHTLESLMTAQCWARIDLLKLDCEGSEFNILTHCDLSRIGFILGEYHGQAAFLNLVQGERFAGAGWRYRILNDVDGIGQFWLWRRS